MLYVGGSGVRLRRGMLSVGLSCLVQVNSRSEDGGLAPAGRGAADRSSGEGVGDRPGVRSAPPRPRRLRVGCQASWQPHSSWPGERADRSPPRSRVSRRETGQTPPGAGSRDAEPSGDCRQGLVNVLIPALLPARTSGRIKWTVSNRAPGSGRSWLMPRKPILLAIQAEDFLTRARQRHPRWKY